MLDSQSQKPLSETSPATAQVVNGMSLHVMCTPRARGPEPEVRVTASWPLHPSSLDRVLTSFMIKKKIYSIPTHPHPGSTREQQTNFVSSLVVLGGLRHCHWAVSEYVQRDTRQRGCYDERGAPYIETKISLHLHHVSLRNQYYCYPLPY